MRFFQRLKEKLKDIFTPKSIKLQLQYERQQREQLLKEKEQLLKEIQELKSQIAELSKLRSEVETLKKELAKKEEKEIKYIDRTCPLRRVIVNYSYKDEALAELHPESEQFIVSSRADLNPSRVYAYYLALSTLNKDKKVIFESLKNYSYGVLKDNLNDNTIYVKSIELYFDDRLETYNCKTKQIKIINLPK